MIVLGIDPGTAICGYGLINIEGNHLRVIEYGAVLTKAHTKPEYRLKSVYSEIKDLINQYKPDIMGIEQLFFNRNITTAIPVAQARGVVLLAAAEAGLEVVERTPLQIKQAVAGYGKASKEQVIYMVQRLLNLAEKPKPDDVADALAAAICAAYYTNNQSWSSNL